MSHIVKTQLKSIRSKMYLIEALKKMGYTVTENVKVKAFGSEQQQADIVINEKPSIGFSINKDGNYDLVADFYNTGLSRDEFEHNVAGYYQLAQVEANLPFGFVVDKVESTSNKIEVTLREVL